MIALQIHYSRHIDRILPMDCVLNGVGGVSPVCLVLQTAHTSLVSAKS